MAEYASADTNVVSYLTKVSEQSASYQKLLGNRRIAISFQAHAELLGAGFGAKRQQRLNDLLAAILILPQSEATSIWYSRVAARRSELRKAKKDGAAASDADVWIISSALEHRLSLLSHDKQQVQLGRAIGLKVVTNLEGLRDDNPRL
jgi:predicted nucleic acid-binding protein